MRGFRVKRHFGYESVKREFLEKYWESQGGYKDIHVDFFKTYYPDLEVKLKKEYNIKQHKRFVWDIYKDKFSHEIAIVVGFRNEPILVSMRCNCTERNMEFILEHCYRVITKKEVENLVKAWIENREFIVYLSFTTEKEHIIATYAWGVQEDFNIVRSLKGHYKDEKSEYMSKEEFAKFLFTNRKFVNKGIFSGYKFFGRSKRHRCEKI